MPPPPNKRNYDHFPPIKEDDDHTADDDAPPKKKPSTTVSTESDKCKSNDAAAAVDSEEDGMGPITGTNPTPIFLKKTYRMIDSCDPLICTWSPDGLSFIVKDPEAFAAEIIPQYFDHNKFSSFARQLNCKRVKALCVYNVACPLY